MEKHSRELAPNRLLPPKAQNTMPNSPRSKNPIPRTLTEMLQTVVSPRNVQILPDPELYTTHTSLAVKYSPSRRPCPLCKWKRYLWEFEQCHCTHLVCFKCARLCRNCHSTSCYGCRKYNFCRHCSTEICIKCQKQCHYCKYLICHSHSILNLYDCPKINYQREKTNLRDRALEKRTFSCQRYLDDY